jgi:phosphohistidine phosphatase SixA
MDRRSALKTLSACGPWVLASPLHASPQAEALIRQGGVVVVFRHADAPGTFDPPGFSLNDCSTQRNLGPQGRDQARQIGQWFAERGLKPQTVRSSPWCRCQDTARLAFGTAEVWPALGSPVGVSPEVTTGLRGMGHAPVRHVRHGRPLGGLGRGLGHRPRAGRRGADPGYAAGLANLKTPKPSTMARGASTNVV